ncbi:hypothetical protein AKJ53_00090 [candidate division MSBL1 archaeon SCGC-AAA382F02]|uniref:NH(3)-dependent NAD(+) synthetase n=1 Tax=candidate division MSBL1 archaeon SCGC-AAA382F02 TaxID=1698282 RepID=A0A133VJB8_9EURY|nr:hypothetical protein AKJ53_00090 [candidate division MSBL1 archaeon SCGC-AAA382F02]
MNKLKEIEKALEIKPSKAKKQMIDFIAKKVKNAGANGTVLGLSGGLDSVATAYLCAEAIDEENVLAVFMPEKGVTDPKNAEDSEKISDELGINFEKVQISPILEKMKDQLNFKEDKLSEANLKARIRMTILYYYANVYNYLVVGTSNKSELRCGYFTKYGDGAADLLPLGAIYKTQLKKIAEELGVPQNIIEKTPTAGLWKGQNDEKELGLPYEKIDQIYAGLEIGLNVSEIAAATEIEESKVEEFKTREKNSKHKLRAPSVPEI